MTSAATFISLPSPAPRWHCYLAWSSLALLVGFAAWLRTRDFTDSFWLDELHTAWCVVDDLIDVAPRAIQGNQPPLPYWLLWCWVQLFGVSEWSLRGPALVASLATIVLAYFVVWNWTRSCAGGLVAAFFLAIEPESIRYGNEARVYAWLQLLALGHVWLTTRVLENGTWRTRAAWVMVALLLVHTHYLAALLVAAESLVLLTMCLLARISRRPHPCKLMNIAFDLAILALGAAPLVPHVRDVAARSDNWALFISEPTIARIWEAIPFCRVLCDATLLLVVVIVARRLLGWKPLMAKLSWRSLFAVVATFFLSWSSAWLLSYADVARIFIPRYRLLLYALPALLLGLLVSAFATSRLRGAALVLCSVLLFASSPVFLDYIVEPQKRPRRDEDWRGAVQWLNSRPPTGRTPIVLLASGLIEGEGLIDSDDRELKRFCSYPLRSAYQLSQPTVIHPLPALRPGVLSADELSFLQRHRDAYFVVRGSPAHRRQLVHDLRISLRPYGGAFLTRPRPAFGEVEILTLATAPPFLSRPTGFLNTKKDESEIPFLRRPYPEDKLKAELVEELEEMDP